LIKNTFSNIQLSLKLYLTIYSNVSSGSEWSSTVKLEAETDGDLQINVSFACDELKDIVGLVAVAAEF